MDFAQIIDEFANSERVPEMAIRAALAEGPAIVPKFIELLERYAAGSPLRDEEEQALTIIIHILGEIGDSRAFQPLMKVFSGDAERLDETFGDAVTETVAQILISTFDGDVDRVTTMMSDLAVDAFSRNAAFDVWTYLVLTGRIGRDEARAYLVAFPDTVNPPKGDFGWESWIEAVAYLGFEDLSERVETAFTAGCFPPGPMGMVGTSLRDFRSLLQETRSVTDREAWMRRNRLQPFGGALADISQWYCYSEKYKAEQRRMERESLFDEMARNPYRSVGRNDPCPCGSGKKYKKCCLR